LIGDRVKFTSTDPTGQANEMRSTDVDMNTNHDHDSTALSEEASESAGRLSRLPVTYSILAADALLAMIERTYELPSPLTCELLLPSMNDTYLLAGKDSRYIVRVYRASWRSAGEIAYELDLLTHLAARGVSVSLPLAGIDGCLCRPLTAPEGVRNVALFTYAEGEPLTWTNVDQCRAAGHLLAAIHNATDDFISSHHRTALDVEHLIDAPLLALQPFIEHRPDDWGYLVALTAKLRARLGEVRGMLDWGPCHGDFGGGNLFVADNCRLTAFDFDLCGPGWRACDLAAIQFVATARKDARIWDAFAEGYSTARPLGNADRAAVLLFDPIRRLWRMGLQAGNAPDWGISRLKDTVVDNELRFLRTWEAEYLKDS
jgi:Ser/Thr protein kinase RdoA (MazF antagonist)